MEWKKLDLPQQFVISIRKSRLQVCVPAAMGPTADGAYDLTALALSVTSKSRSFFQEEDNDPCPLAL